jgi:excisionase family DNA binding protein
MIRRVRDAAAAIGVSAKTLRRYIREGKLAATRLPSGHYRIDDTDLDALRTASPRDFDPDADAPIRD